MNKLKAGLVLLVIFIASIYCSFYFEESYRRLIRHLYVALSNGKISFFIPKKYLHFASGEFVLSFGLFIIALCFLSYRQTTKQRVVNIALGLFFFVASVLTQSYFDSFFKLVECTACSDGTRQLHYGDINYDTIFIISLILAIIPVTTTEIRKLIKSKKQQA
jgi:glycerol uptake facilitator-like aquaporin